MELAGAALAAILALARPPAVDPVAERPRLEGLASAIADAVEEREELSSWLPGSMAGNPSTPERTAIALVVIAGHESAFMRKVSTCEIVGFAEPSITAFQLHGPWAWGGHSKRALCRSVRLAARQALYVLATQSKRCGGIERGFWGYASGDCSRSTRAGRELVAMWRRTVARAEEAARE
jgi:hypothetical protein